MYLKRTEAHVRTLADVRRENLEAVLKKYKTVADFNEALGRKRKDTTITQIRNQSGLNSGRPRKMGADLARDIEKKLALPDGWLDDDHFQQIQYIESEETKVFPMKTIASSGADPMLKETVYLDDELFVRHFPGIDRSEFVAAIVHDTSMAPTISPGDRVLIKLSQEFTTDGIYCVETSAGRLLRRIVFNLKGSHDVSADSRPGGIATLEELKLPIIGRVKMIWHVNFV